MTLRLQSLAIAGAALAAAFSVGWLLATPPVVTKEDVALALPSLRSSAPSERTLERVAKLDRTPVPEPASDPTGEPAPPQPDVAQLFRRDLTAIEQTATGPVAWIVDLDQLTGRRALRPGQAYRDGWRVAAIGAQAVELRKRRETRRVALFDPVELAP